MNKKLSIDEVLDALAASADRPSEALVREWSGKYPEFEREIVEFAVEWAATDLTLDDAGLESEQEDRMVTRTMSHIQQVSYQLERQAVATPATNSVSVIAAQLDRVEAAFRAQSGESSWPTMLGIDETILALFEEHMISPPVPRRLLTAFSTALKLPVEAVNAWLFQDSRPQVASYAAKTPAFERWTFKRAVEKSSLPDALKQQWLSETADS